MSFDSLSSMSKRTLQILCFCVGALLTANSLAEESDTAPTAIDWSYYIPVWLPDLPRATADEPRLPRYDEGKAAQFLDKYAVEWAEKNGCGTCHTTVPALMARPLITSVPGDSAIGTIRTKLLEFSAQHRKESDAWTVPFLIPGASALAINDVESGRALDPRVSELFDYIYAHQSPDGSWPYPDHPALVPFLERDTSYVAILAALAAGYAPGYFAERPGARRGLEQLKEYLRQHLPEKLHNQIVLLWASVRLSGLLTAEQQSAIEKWLLKDQNADGGWTLASFGRWPRHDGAPNDPHGPSDGYATGLATLVLCERGYKEPRAPIRKSLAWIESNQRVSGRWFTRSLYSDQFKNYLSNMATAYDVMALHRCRAN
jgi:squalene-hopene/tetraprenyl-beta-curcumene cyclase